MTDRPRWGWTLALAALGTFLTALDIVVVSIALPTLRQTLHASLADLEWTINSYNLVFAALMLTGAALGDRFGRRRMYVLGVALFTLASAAAALSTSTGTLIAARVVQGAGAAVVMPLTVTLVADVVPRARRAMAIGVLGGVTGLGVAAGPVLGGAIVEGISWQWIFWINVPVGVAVAVLSALRLRESHGPRPQLDVPGLLLAAATMFALVWAPVRAPSAGWGSAEVVGALVGGVLLAAAFVAWELRAAHPMVPVAYFRQRGFASANAVGFLQQTSLIGSLFMITQLFQVGMGYAPFAAGLRILVWMAAPVFIAPAAGLLAGRLGNRPVLLAGLVLQAVGLGWLAVATGDAGFGYGDLVVPLVVAGVGISLCFPVVANAITDVVPFEEIGIASGANKATVELGSVAGVAVMAAVFARSGGYADPGQFVDGFGPAILAAAGIAALGLAAAVFVPSRAAAADSDAITAGVAVMPDPSRR
ncbi:DHA2 family efflux MFS transporter permease subunit [Dactylosporangium sp. NPDC049525]|uniref:DHA2 family efflux MFS transporter permease subunit n=1 Tax=Dactylosporangium sp. NPDC049525 TaxID=3154730 RepID=UPI00341ECF39